MECTIYSNTDLIQFCFPLLLSIFTSVASFKFNFLTGFADYIIIHKNGNLLYNTLPCHYHVTTMSLPCHYHVTTYITVWPKCFEGKIFADL